MNPSVCQRVLSCRALSSHVRKPTDAIKLDIPTYYKVIKKPMDMSTMRKKLEAGEYPNATKFFEDFKLMIRNCFAFNPAGTPVNQAGIDLQRLFDEKWKSLPPLRDASDEEEDEYEDEEEEEERNRGYTSRFQSDQPLMYLMYTGRIATMEAQIESMRGNLMALKNKPAKEKKKKEKKEKAPIASSSKATVSRAPKATPAANGNKRKATKKPVAEDDVLSFEQKKDLSEAITSLDGVKLEKVIQIIHEGVPEIRDVSQKYDVAYYSNNMMCRAPRRLNSRSMYYHHMSSPSCTTSSFVHCGNRHRNGIEPGRARELVALNGRAWTKLLKLRRYVNWRRECGSLRIQMQLQSHPMLHLCRLVSTTAIVHRTLLQTTARAVSRSNHSSVSCVVACCVWFSRSVVW